MICMDYANALRCLAVPHGQTKRDIMSIEVFFRLLHILACHNEIHLHQLVRSSGVNTSLPHRTLNCLGAFSTPSAVKRVKSGPVCVPCWPLLIVSSAASLSTLV